MHIVVLTTQIFNRISPINFIWRKTPITCRHCVKTQSGTTACNTPPVFRKVLINDNESIYTSTKIMY